LGQKKIITVYHQEQKLILATQNNGFYHLENGIISFMRTQIDDFLINNNIYCSTVLKNGNIAVGTISNGLYLIDAAGNLKYHFSQSKGLTNNTILSLYEDEDNNLWTGLDNGINCINVESAVKNFSDQSGTLGTVYASMLFQNKLYIGTNQGLFTKTTNSNSSFELISGTKGQVWSLFTYQNTLFCGHNSGTFVIDNNSARQIYSASGTWKFSTISGQPNLLLQGNYNGISVLERINKQWTFRNKIDNFNCSSKFFELQKNQIFVSHEYKGIYRFSVDENFRNASTIHTYQNPKKGKNVSLIKYNDKILFASTTGIYKLLANNIFEKDNILTAIWNNDQFISGKMIADNAGKLWMFSENYIHYFEKHKLSTTLKHTSIPIPSALANTMVGYENISQLNQNQYLLGTSDGYCIIDINNLNFKKYNVSITNADFYEFEQKSQSANLTVEGSFGYKQNNVVIGFTVPEYNKYINTEYQYHLEGYQNKWSDWSSKSVAVFKNLPPGDYIFEVKSKIANVVSDRLATYSFVIKRPWYGSILMKFIYLIIIIIGVFYVNKAYEKYYQKQKQKLIDENNKLLEFKELENEKQLMQVKNEQLIHDVDLKNRELAVSNMSLIKKDELLALIKEDLKKSDQENGNRSIKSVISTITRNINKDDSWNAFNEAFDNTDKDFLKKVKSLHVALTPNDLRLCAYLRLNLSSKEIAPMLNISVRSVEIKRYRLRKKMELSHEQGLVEYILSI
jgi:DNA-binding CsgD family transcriptional regulator